MILEPQTKASETPLHPRPQLSSPHQPPVWRRPRLLLAVFGVAVLATATSLVLSWRSNIAPAAATPTPTALIAHGQVVPVQQARVGTLGGGQVQQLGAVLGSEVTAQTPLAWVTGPSGTEIVTAPFDGAVTNVLVHTGDTLMPGATIAVVANMHSLQVETVDVDEFLVSHVKAGQRLEVTVDALDNLALTGMVTHVALLPQASSGGSQAYPVIISLGVVPPSVRAGMSVRVTLAD